MRTKKTKTKNLEDSKKIFEKTFGLLKGRIKKSTQQIKDELRRELY